MRETGRIIIYKAILVLGLLPGTLMLFFAFSGLSILLSQKTLGFEGIALVIAIIMSILGYAGLISSLINPKWLKINLVLLISGILGFVAFISLEGGFHAWKWILTMEEPGEWFLVCWPIISGLTGIIVNAKRIKCSQPE